MKKLLIANRGEIAVRIIRAARELGIETVAVASEADAQALHARSADTCIVIGPAPAGKSYLNEQLILDAALSVGADAIHPGYGFLSERAAFAQAVIDSGLTWVGPNPSAIAQMGDKAQAIKTALAAGVPTIPGSAGPVASIDEAVEVASRTGYPLVIKASAGGGGKGIRVAVDESELRSLIPIAQAESLAAFGSDEVYVERMVTGAKHIEVQVFGDGETIVHVGERECSVQRRRQKLIEETPAPLLPAAVRAEMCSAAVALAAAVGYQGAGTVEFLYEPKTSGYYFIEMNTRIQVEHPITEAVTGIDLVVEQLRVAAGEKLSFTQEDVLARGHAIEIRLNAEDPSFQFMPSPGYLEKFNLPSGPFIRIDSGFTVGDTVTPFYDSLLAKVISWGRTREESLSRMRRALHEMEVVGVKTTSSFLLQVIDSPGFIDGSYDTLFLES